MLFCFVFLYSNIFIRIDENKSCFENLSFGLSPSSLSTTKKSYYENSKHRKYELNVFAQNRLLSLAENKHVRNKDNNWWVGGSQLLCTHS
jgi:hypothetical protein